MITYIWAVGIGIAVLVFAGKAGLIAGMSKLRLLEILALAFIYAEIVFLTGCFLKVFSPLDYFQFFQKFSSLGILLHFFVALGLLAWGIYLIKFFVNGKFKTASKARLILMLPCPACLLTMLLSVSMFAAVTGIELLKAGGIMAGSLTFIIIIITLLSKRLVQKKEKSAFPILLGFIMIMTGLYFIASIFIVPLYAQSKAIFQVAQNMRRPSFPLTQLLWFLITVFSFIGFGFLKERKELKR